jgi:hypothetical protein
MTLERRWEKEKENYIGSTRRRNKYTETDGWKRGYILLNRKKKKIERERESDDSHVAIDYTDDANSSSSILFLRTDKLLLCVFSSLCSLLNWLLLLIREDTRRTHKDTYPPFSLMGLVYLFFFSK